MLVFLLIKFSRLTSGQRHKVHLKNKGLLCLETTHFFDGISARILTMKSVALQALSLLKPALEIQQKNFGAKTFLI